MDNTTEILATVLQSATRREQNALLHWFRVDLYTAKVLLGLLAQKYGV